MTREENPSSFPSNVERGWGNGAGEQGTQRLLRKPCQTWLERVWGLGREKHNFVVEMEERQLARASLESVNLILVRVKAECDSHANGGVVRRGKSLRWHAVELM